MIQIQDIMRAGHIKRWNIVNTTRQQTLAEHMYNVTMIAIQLCNEIDEEEFIPEVTQWALMHDVPEVVCGDTPTPAKRHMKDAGFDMEDVYDKVDPTYKKVKEELSPLAHWIVKMADLIEAYWFIREHGVGDHAKMVADKIHARIGNHAAKDEPYRGAIAIKLMSRVMNGKIYE